MFHDWIELVRSLGAALLEVYRAEASELRSELRSSSKRLAAVAGLFAAAALVVVCLIATLVYFLIQVLALWLPLWGAAGVMVLALAATAVVLVWLGARRFARWEGPGETIRRRFAGHRTWLEDRLLPSRPGIDPRRDVEPDDRGPQESREEER